MFEDLPAKRQTLLFTATWPKAVRKLCKGVVRTGAGEAVSVFVGGGGAVGAAGAESGELEANVSITQRFIKATDDEKDKKLYESLPPVKPYIWE